MQIGSIGSKGYINDVTPTSNSYGVSSTSPGPLIDTDLNNHPYVTVGMSEEAIALAEAKYMEGKTIGIWGVNEIGKDCDILYVPKHIADSMPKIWEIRSQFLTISDITKDGKTLSKITPEKLEANQKALAALAKPSSSDLARMKSIYLAILEEFGIDYKDPDSLKRFVLDKDLKAEIDRVFEERFK